MQPFQSQPLHPTRRTVRDARHEIEGPAHPHGHGHRQFMAMAVDPVFLLGMPVGDEEDVGLRGRQPAGNGRPAGVVGLPSYAPATISCG